MACHLRGLARRLRARLPVGRPTPAANTTLPAMRERPSVKPILPVADVAATSDFYRSLGFEVVAYDDTYAWVRHCGWELFHLAAVDEPGDSGAGAALYLHVADADAWRAGLVASGADVSIGAVADMPWGMREFAVTDPGGNVIRIGHNL